MNLELVIDIARNRPRAGKNRYNIVAIVTDRRDKILSIGFNSYKKTHPLQKRYGERTGNPDRIFLHAEIAALVKCRSEGDRIYIARVDKQGNKKPAYPCPVCRLAIIEAGIREIIST